MKIGILNGGGDTPSLNAIIYGAAKEAEKKGSKVIGFRRGWQGALDSDYVDVEAVKNIGQGQFGNPTIVDLNLGGTMLLSSRTKLKGNDIDKATENIAAVVDGLIAIGGDDTLSVGKEISERSHIPVCLVSKTIDNDVGSNAPEGIMDYNKIVNYFTTGFATAARKSFQFAYDLGTTSMSHERIMFMETMGRGPGWLALASYKAKPDLILVPEIGLDYEHFLGKLEEIYRKQGYAIVVVAEGVKYKDSDKPISQDNTQTDVFGHAKLGGVAETLAKRVKTDLGIANSNSVNPDYLYRSGDPCGRDIVTSLNLGYLAADSIMKGITGHVAVLERQGDEIKAVRMPVNEVLLTDTDGKIIPRTLDQRFYDKENYSITKAGIEYFKPIMSDPE